jgi:putative ATP-dependent endonuclease of the OLD family
MKIDKVEITNFKSIKQLTFHFRDLIFLIGENNSGKSNIIEAIKVFFESSGRNIKKEYFYGKNTDNPIEITIDFGFLTEEELNEKRLQQYVLDKRLCIRKVISFNKDEEKFETKMKGKVKEPKIPYLKLSNFEEFKDNLTQIVKENKLPDYFKSASGRVTQESYKTAVYQYIKDNEKTIEWSEPIFSETNFQGFKEYAQSFLPKFRFLPAVQEATEESVYDQKNFFGQILDEMLLKDCDKIGAFTEASKNLTQVEELIGACSEKKAIEQKILTALKETMPSTEDIRIGVKVPTIQDIVQTGISIALNDGVETDVQSKGHGLQRALVLALLRVFAEYVKTSAETGAKIPVSIFAIEEPELYLHPQHQRILFEILEKLSISDQVIFCTHSTFCIDMEHYESIIIVSKNNPTDGTKVFQCLTEIFPPGEKDHFKMINEFDPERNELFFAKKVILVEGDSEKIAIPRLSKIMGKDLNEKGISVIECSSKFNIRLFVKVLNQFKIPYLVIHDEDPIDTTLTGEKLEQARRVFAENAKIEAVIDHSLGNVKIFQPNLDQLLGLSQSQIDTKGKPFAIHQKIATLNPTNIPQEIKEAIALMFQ